MSERKETSPISPFFETGMHVHVVPRLERADVRIPNLEKLDNLAGNEKSFMGSN